MSAHPVDDGVPLRDLAGTTTVVVGVSRGLGRGIAEQFAAAGSDVVAVSRTRVALAELAASTPNVRPEVADAAEAPVASGIIDQYAPDAVIVVAGAAPVMRPLQEQTWETFSTNWHADVKIAFHWLSATLSAPLRPGSRVVVVSSGAALVGSPLSGGYAGAKATQRFITGYAQGEADRAGLGITFAAVLPRITPRTGLGRAAVEAYAARAGQSEQQYVEQMGEPLTPQGAGAALVGLVRADAAAVAPAQLLTADGLQRIPGP